MKVLQVTAIDMTMNNFLYSLNKESKKQGIEVHCLCSKGPNVDIIKKNGFYFHEVNIDRNINLVKNLKSIIMMVKVFRIVRPDIVHVHTPVAGVLARIAAKIAKVPNIIYTAHGFYFHEGMGKIKYNIFFYIEKYIGRYFTDHIFTQSIEDFEVAKKNKFLKNNNYLHISNGVDLEVKFNPKFIETKAKSNIISENNFKENDLIVTFIGRLVKEKGIIEFLNSYEKLKTQNIKYVIIGGLPQGERDTEAIKVVEKFKGNKNIIFTDHVNNVNDYLNISDIFCLPSYREGMPRSIIEAMAMRNAVLATNIRGSREEVLHNETGYLFDVRNSNQIAKYIDELNNDREKLEYFKEYGQKRAKLLYDEDKVVKKQIDIYKKIVNK
ncbi:glycosyltransferase family 4 protein [Staphylococcus saprophyticus]|jgi:glycosyltransferase involved in cell wall biosynthesis|uniref:glycosyltransferase family 4 protein n=1 Tax=Staphylococcus saprophyticus TaxID=29385 RepID=UPI001642945B|nr:glycosyltransferase family 4 protein [Staphylococcus saprophyticus]MBC2920287.1 glycosyltransferase family 4 protein [Staphylococcus saprophyticus]MBC2958276.1 glycosyltransferase family 4 protein [Staphylococcus saprophyticus]MBC3008302.1 glycosyltransferase family 4 protein [Staphylococcus saprophyticus]MBC3022607.1 glycosyltransferase family 4 protein [Staphylococcus saprophyticus]MBC3031261.1 glycosyltransferase family 4 protein [Staphylococcus saprophyticus]